MYYRTNNLEWKMTHVLCIFAHLGLIIAAAIAYVYNNMAEVTAHRAAAAAAAADWAAKFKLASTDMMTADPHQWHLYNTALGNGGFISPGSFDLLSIQTLTMSCLVLGILGLVTNVGLFVILLAVEPTKVTLTEGEQHWRRQMVTVFSCVLNIVLVGAGVGLAGAIGIRVTAHSKSLITPLAWLSIQAPLSLTTALYDAVKNHREGKDLLD
ncbi:hypothetical protein B0T22DRAFT_271253 [Podospora appendiculata]|uniref:Uncharacterized protein n=1 Tax=Podospora appendiculata TaxID=314037 RepID=A0AAE0X3R2_9PEZI|nr:hypothetical protein B0T22DRAFT_271253 [Podospora appendiculata]